MKIFKKNELQYLGLFYLSSFISSLFAMIGPYLILYFLGLGLSYFKISIIVSSLGISVFVFELPTGAMADGVSRKYSVVLGFFIMALATALMPFAKDFSWILVAWVFVGLGMTFISGAQTAWVIDNLNEKERSDLTHEYFVKSSSASALGAVFAPILGTVVVKYYSMDALWFAFGTGAFLCTILLLVFTKEYYKPQKIKMANLFSETYNISKSGLQFTFTNRTVLLLIIADLFVGLMLFGNAGEQPFLVSLGMAEYQLGYMYTIIAVVGLATPFLSKLFVDFKPKHVISFVILGRMILFLSLLFIYPPYSLMAAVLIITRNGLYSFVGPISGKYFNKFILKGNRATIISIKSMISQLITGVCALAAGTFLDMFGPQKVLALGSLFGIVALVLYQKIKD